MKVKALEVVSGQYLLVATLSDLVAHCVYNPEHVDTARQTDLDKPFNSGLRRAHAVRGNNQRSWSKKARKERRDDYAAYIKAVRAGDRLGGFPPVTMWTKADAVFDGEMLDVPGSAVVCAHDGETQLSAWCKLSEADPQYMDVEFPIVLYTSATQELADQQLHDFNHYASPVSETEMALHNREGALTAALREGMVNSGRQIALIVNHRSDVTGKKYLTTEARLIELAVGAAFGADSFQCGTRKLTEDGNAQFYVLPNADIVTACVCEFLTLSDEDIKSVGKIDARAIGAYFNTHGTLPRSFPSGEDIAAAKESVAQKSKPLQVVARNLFKMMNNGRRAA